MNDEQRCSFRERAEMILKNLKNCNSGAEIHQVGNMRNIAQLVIEMSEKCGEASITLIERTLKSLEKQQSEFFKKKFENWK